MSASGTASIGYDARGNVTGLGGAGYGYNSRNRLNRFAGGYIYNTPLDELFDVSTEQRWLMRSGGEVLTELGYDGQTKRRYVWGPGSDEPLVWYEGAGTGDRRYLHADERGSIVAVSNDADNAIAINTYDEYGMPGAGNIGRFQYTGQKWLPELGLYDYKARMYSPKLGRFMQTDPIGYGDGLNLYGYVGGDPVNFRDPWGLCAKNEVPNDEGGCDIVVTGKRLKNADPFLGGTLGVSISPVSFSGGLLPSLANLPTTDEAPDTPQNVDPPCKPGVDCKLPTPPNPCTIANNYCGPKPKPVPPKPPIIPPNHKTLDYLQDCGLGAVLYGVGIGLSPETLGTSLLAAGTGYLLIRSCR